MSSSSASTAAARRLVLLISAVALVETLFFSIVVPLLPWYAEELGLSKTAAGVLVAAYPAGTLLAAIPAGIVAARIGAKPTVLLGMGLLSAASVVFGFAQDVRLLDAARFLQGVGGACAWVGGLAWVVQATPREHRGGLIGTVMGAAQGGALLGPVVGSVGVAVGPGVMFGAIGVLGSLLVAVGLRIPGPAPAPAQSPRAVLSALRVPRVLGTMWLVMVPALALGVIGVLGPIRLALLGAGSVVVGVAFFAASALQVWVNPKTGRVSDVHGRWAVLRIALPGSALLLLAFTLPGGVIGLTVLIVATITVVATMWSPAMALLSDVAEGAGLQQSFAFGLMMAAWGIGHTGGSSGGAALAEATSDAVPVAVIAMLALLTLAAGGIYGRRRATAS